MHRRAAHLSTRLARLMLAHARANGIEGRVVETGARHVVREYLIGGHIYSIRERRVTPTPDHPSPEG